MEIERCSGAALMRFAGYFAGGFLAAACAGCLALGELALLLVML